jgi:hypothetical protein
MYNSTLIYLNSQYDTNFLKIYHFSLYKNFILYDSVNIEKLIMTYGRFYKLYPNEEKIIFNINDRNIIYYYNTDLKLLNIDDLPSGDIYIPNSFSLKYEKNNTRIIYKSCKNNDNNAHCIIHDCINPNSCKSSLKLKL